jgi:uncharacterized membrane protein YidH (DUF202 family)
MNAFRPLVLVLLGLLLLGGVGYLLAAWAPQRWPRLQAALVRLGDAVFQMALGITGLVIVVVVLRALGWIPRQ